MFIHLYCVPTDTNSVLITYSYFENAVYSTLLQLGISRQVYDDSLIKRQNVVGGRMFSFTLFLFFLLSLSLFRVVVALEIEYDTYSSAMRSARLKINGSKIGLVFGRVIINFFVIRLYPFTENCRVHFSGSCHALWIAFIGRS